MLIADTTTTASTAATRRGSGGGGGGMACCLGRGRDGEVVVWWWWVLHTYYSPHVAKSAVHSALAHVCRVQGTRFDRLLERSRTSLACVSFGGF